MELIWKSIDNKEIKILNAWLTRQDKHNLCMTQKSWEQTAFDINDCLKNMDNVQFKNIMGYANGQPVVAIMFAIENTGVLNLYNIVVNPVCRNMGIAKNAIIQLLKNDSSLKLIVPYKKVKASTLPDNEEAQQLFKSLNFDNLGYNGEYVVFEKGITNINEKQK